MATPTDLDPVLADLAQRLRAALDAADLPAADPDFERPRDPDHGDWATAMALRLAKPVKKNPREIAQAVVDALELPDAVSSVEIAGPGFLNFRFSDSYWHDVVGRVLDADGEWGRTQTADPEKVNVEFVSANPTGPLHAGAGRWAATGDAIAELLAAVGHDVEREYYVNDAGEQVRLFGETVALVHAGKELGEDHYKGDYVTQVASEIAAEHGAEVFHGPVGAADTATPDLAGGGAGHDHDGDLVLDDDAVPGTDEPSVDPNTAAALGALAVEAMRGHIEQSLEDMGVHFDVWFSERQRLHETGAIEDTIADLRERGVTREADGALFLLTSEHGDDKDRVLVRSDGRPTYFAADCAYMRDKWSRADRLYYLLGADHHGYVARLKAAAACLGIPPEALEIRIGQLVNLLRGGEPVRMSKRAGEFVTLEEVVEEVGVDVARYHFLRQSLDSTVDFDLDEVTKQSSENPVYYVQYAHARIASVIKKADDEGFDHGTAADDLDTSVLTTAPEIALLRGLAAFPGVVDEAAEQRATQRLTRFIEEYAAEFQRFYTECRILPPASEGGVGALEGDEAATTLARSRYWLAVAAKQVLGNALALLRVSAPESM